MLTLATVAAAPAAGAATLGALAARTSPGVHQHAGIRNHAVGRRNVVLGLADPSSSDAPGAAFDDVCLVRYHAGACNAVALADIDQARRAEGLGPMVLPERFARWSTVAQLTWVANAERTARGLPALANTAGLDRLAALGAQENADPTGPANATWGSNISFGYTTALAADFAWMYDDGPGSPNLDCSGVGGGCWGHRNNILSDFAGTQGDAVFADNGVLQMTELFVAS